MGEGMRSKTGYGNGSDVDDAISGGLLDGGDYVVTKDSHELLFLEPNTTEKITIQSKTLTFDSVEDAEDYVNADKTTYPGKPLSVKELDGNYWPYLVQKSGDKFVVKPVSSGMTIVEF